MKDIEESDDEELDYDECPYDFIRKPTGTNKGMTHDELLFCPYEDEQNTNWVNKKLRSNPKD